MTLQIGEPLTDSEKESLERATAELHREFDKLVAARQQSRKPFFERRARP